MKTPAPKENSTSSKSSQSSFDKNGGGNFLSSSMMAEPFFLPTSGIQKKSTSSLFSGGNNTAQVPFLSGDTLIQTKLSINEPGDKYEQEADAMADKVMRMTTVPSGREGAIPQYGFSKVPSLQRKCGACEEKDKVQRQEIDEKKPVQAKPLMRKAEGGGYTASSLLQSQLNSSKGGGNPLPGKTLASMNHAFGADFSTVRIHTDSRAVGMSQGIQAKAFTHGSDIYFNRGQYSSESPEGKRLLGHELTHVVQQESGVRRVNTYHVQRSAMNGVLQRQPTKQKTKPEIKFRIGWLTDDGIPVETNGQIAALARLTIASLEDDLSDVKSEAVKTQASEWIDWVKWALPYFEKHAGEKIDQFFVESINQKYDELLQIREAVRQDGMVQIKEALWREHAAAIKAAEKAEALQPALDDALRAAYRKGSDSTLKDTVSMVKGALSIGRNLRTLAADISKDIFGLPIASGTKIYIDHWTSQIGRAKVTIINVSKYTDTLAKLGRGLSALSVALTIADRSKRATHAEQGMKDLSDAVTIGTDLISASPLAAPPHFSLYSTLYLKPALKVISKQIGMLIEQLSDVNRIAVEVTGDLMYPNAEPGGQEMFDLMVKVMRARDESGFPALPSSVKEYLFDHREKLGIGAESDVPTEGSFFWKDLDGPAARHWLFTNRQRVWAMFYGSMKVPRKKH